MSVPTLIIYNMFANQGAARRSAAALTAAAAGKPYLTWAITAYHRHAIELARQSAERGFRRVIAFGGDGTVHEVVNGLMQIPVEQRPEFGVVPAGSGNDFSASLGIPRDPQEALELALHSEARWIDAALMKDDSGRSEYFINTLGIGFDAVANLLAHQADFLPGFSMYLAAALRTIFFESNPIRIRAVTDKQSWEDEVLLFIACNGRREGRLFTVAPQAQPDDGRLDFVAVRTISPPQMLATIPYMMRGDHNRLSYCYQGYFTRLELSADQPLIMHADGEILAGLDSNIRSVTIEAVPRAIRAVAPALDPAAKVGGHA
jgi:YegS/Rv2252/BmrU family lipid kinase